MQHHLRFFRFNHRTLVPSGKDLTLEDFFAPDDHSNKPNDEDVKLLDDFKSKPQKHREATENATEKPPQSPSESSLAGEEQVLIENTTLPDEYILSKIIGMSKK